MLYGLCSSYKEGPLLTAAVVSLQRACDVVCVFEGPVGDDKIEESSQMDLPRGLPEFWNRIGHWKDDASKRTQMLQWVKVQHEVQNLRSIAGDPWIVWLDGDEILLWGEFLRDHIYNAEKTTGAGGFPLRIVEYDGSVAKGHNRVMNASVVERFEVAASQVVLATGMLVSLPNVQVCGPGGIPYGWGEAGVDVTPADLAELRPPLAGEPHILHRAFLRDPQRNAERQHLAEARAWHEMEERA